MDTSETCIYDLDVEISEGERWAEVNKHERALAPRLAKQALAPKWAWRQ